MLQDYESCITELFAPEDDALKSARPEMLRAQCPSLTFPPRERKVLHVLARVIGDSRVGLRVLFGVWVMLVGNRLAFFGTEG